jgi:hypothetical protein
MRYFQEIEFPNFDQSHQELVDYFHATHPDLTKVVDFFSFPSFEKFILMCPTVNAGFKEMGLHLKAVFMITVVPDTNSNIHIDGSPHPCRLQWPIMNSQSVETLWYDIDPSFQIKEMLPNGVPYISYSAENRTEAASKNITSPTIIRVEEPHAVRRISSNSADYPRVAFSFAFEESLEDFLE